MAKSKKEKIEERENEIKKAFEDGEVKKVSTQKSELIKPKKEKKGPKSEDVNKPHESKSEKKVSNTNVNAEQLKTIEKEIKNNKKNKKTKTDIKAKPIYKKIATNVVLAMLFIVYFILLILGATKISAIEYITDLKTFTMINLFVSILLFEVSFSKDDFTFAMHAIEMGTLGGITLWLIDIFVRQINNFNLYIAAFVIITVIYYMIKIIVMRIKFWKKDNI